MKRKYVFEAERGDAVISDETGEVFYIWEQQGFSATGDLIVVVSKDYEGTEKYQVTAKDWIHWRLVNPLDVAKRKVKNE